MCVCVCVSERACIRACVRVRVCLHAHVLCGERNRVFASRALVTVFIDGSVSD